MLTSVRSAALALILTLPLATPASACDIAGTWVGPIDYVARLADRGRQTLTLTVANDCSYQWSSTNFGGTLGRASAGWSAGSYSYRNEAGSFGSFEVSGTAPRQTMKIVQGQGNYTANLTRRR